MAVSGPNELQDKFLHFPGQVVPEELSDALDEEQDVTSKSVPAPSHLMIPSHRK